MYRTPYGSNIVHVGCKNKSDTSNNKGDWIYFKIVQKMPEQCKGKHEIKKNYKRKKAILGTAHILRKAYQSPKHSTLEWVLHVA